MRKLIIKSSLFIALTFFLNNYLYGQFEELCLMDLSSDNTPFKKDSIWDCTLSLDGKLIYILNYGLVTTINSATKETLTSKTLPVQFKIYPCAHFIKSANSIGIVAYDPNSNSVSEDVFEFIQLDSNLEVIKQVSVPTNFLFNEREHALFEINNFLWLSDTLILGSGNNNLWHIYNSKILPGKNSIAIGGYETVDYKSGEFYRITPIVQHIKDSIVIYYKIINKNNDTILDSRFDPIEYNSYGTKFFNNDLPDLYIYDMNIYFEGSKKRIYNLSSRKWFEVTSVPFGYSIRDQFVSGFFNFNRKNNCLSLFYIN